MNATRTLLGLLVLAGLTGSAPGDEQKWGTIKGRVIFDGDPPARKEIESAKGNRDCKTCAADGKVMSDEWVVDGKTKGVRWVLVWLVDEKGGHKIPIHPDHKKIAGDVVIDQPCCMFEPHVVGIRVGQTLVAKNSASFAHNFNINGGTDNAAMNDNKLIPSGTSRKIVGWAATNRPVGITCGIHTWMSARVGVFDHPYFAVTNDKGEFEIKNAPAGKYRIMAWHEAVGWLSGNKGTPLEIKADAVTDVGTIKAKPE